MRAMDSPSNIEVVLHRMEHLYVKWDRKDWMELPQSISFPFRSPTPSCLPFEWVPLIFFAVDAKSTIDINEVRGFEQMSDLHNPSEAHLGSMGILGNKHLLCADCSMQLFSTIVVVFLELSRAAKSIECSL